MQPLVMSETPAATVEESAPARATLNVVRGPQVGISFALTGEPVTIGRSPQCTIFLNDMTVSRMHATIEPGERLLRHPRRQLVQQACG